MKERLAAAALSAARYAQASAALPAPAGAANWTSSASSTDTFARSAGLAAQARHLSPTHRPSLRHAEIDAMAARMRGIAQLPLSMRKAATDAWLQQASTQFSQAEYQECMRVAVAMITPPPAQHGAQGAMLQPLGSDALPHTGSMRDMAASGAQLSSEAAPGHHQVRTDLAPSPASAWATAIPRRKGRQGRDGGVGWRYDSWRLH